MTDRELLEELERQEALEKMTDEDIDFSDIPKITDFSNFRPARAYLQRVAQWNRDHRPQAIQKLREKIAAEEQKGPAAGSMIEELREEERADHARHTAANLLSLGKLTWAEIAESVGLPIGEVQELARRTA